MGEYPICKLTQQAQMHYHSRFVSTHEGGLKPNLLTLLWVISELCHIGGGESELSHLNSVNAASETTCKKNLSNA